MARRGRASVPSPQAMGQERAGIPSVRICRKPSLVTDRPYAGARISYPADSLVGGLLRPFQRGLPAE